ncbi:hypothetical protein EGR_05869 [Echinococcus granulosus]|uniref:Uncharacterized protein n=1 Tax=Echinococcus granulosus TaxID=6210 RepID=W6UDZ8_ECHGR|nr:hypothetical protein EGR_05869 [Echinococcus granulosus]EUB59268.1 hypothetical protein EGR_05869 [Echinococcus granulosus]
MTKLGTTRTPSFRSSDTATATTVANQSLAKESMTIMPAPVIVLHNRHSDVMKP